MKNIKKHILCAVLLLDVATGANAQAPGSVSAYGGSSSIKTISGGTSIDISESVYIGPGTHTIDGTWEIYAKRVIIDPIAVITGTGTIDIHNPGEVISIYPAAVDTPSLVDGNTPLAGTANNIDVNLKHSNNSGILLNEMGFPADLIADGWMNVTNSSGLYVGKDLDLAIDGADITLGSGGIVGNLRFDADATIRNYNPSRMVITNNSVLSHVVKESFSSAFTFPVGIADGDYTPAQITNGGSNTVRVSVQDYVASTSVEATADPGPGGIPADGMKRTWHIYADNAGISALLNLQHNTTSNQSGFNNSSHYVTQWGTDTPNTTGDNTISYGKSTWQTNNLGTGTTGNLIDPSGSLAGSTMRSRSYSSLATSATANESYFSKSSDPYHPLPIQLISFKPIAKDCDVEIKWETGDETELASFQLMYSRDGSNYEVLSGIRPKGKNSEYSYVHVNAGDGIHLYRLKMIEVTGKVTYSSTMQVQNRCDHSMETRLKVYPNPVTNILRVEGMPEGTPYELRLLGMDGKIIISKQTQSYKEELNISHLPSAQYMLQIVGSQHILGNIKINKL